jgi:hypothetical protein
LIVVRYRHLSADGLFFVVKKVRRDAQGG